MALLATTFTTEIIVLIIGLYLFDGGFIRKLGAEALFVLGLQLSYTSQKYVSDITPQPSNVSLFLTPELQRVYVIMFAILSLITLAWTFVEISKIAKFKPTRDKDGKWDLSELFEMMI